MAKNTFTEKPHNSASLPRIEEVCDPRALPSTAGTGSTLMYDAIMNRSRTKIITADAIRSHWPNRPVPIIPFSRRGISATSRRTPARSAERIKARFGAR